MEAPSAAALAPAPPVESGAGLVDALRSVLERDEPPGDLVLRLDVGQRLARRGDVKGEIASEKRALHVAVGIGVDHFSP